MPAVPRVVNPIADVTARATAWRVATTPAFVPIAATADATVPSPVQTVPASLGLADWGTEPTDAASASTASVPAWATLVAFAVGIVLGATLL